MKAVQTGPRPDAPVVKIDHDVATGWFRCAECDREFNSPTRRGTIWTKDGSLLALADVYEHRCFQGKTLNPAVLVAFPDARRALLQTILEACPPEYEEAA